MTEAPVKSRMQSFVALSLALVLVLMPTIFFASDNHDTPSDGSMCNEENGQSPVDPSPGEQQPDNSGEQSSSDSEAEADPDESAPEPEEKPDGEGEPPAESDGSSEDEGADELVDRTEEQEDPEAKAPANGGGLFMRASATIVTDQQGLIDALASGKTDIRISGTITITATLTIDCGVSITGGTLKAGASGIPMFYVDAPGHEVSLVNVTFDGAGIAAGIAAADGNLNVQNCAFQYMNTVGNGAAIEWSSEGSLAVAGTRFTDCSAGINGGGIFADKGDISVSSSNFVRQFAGGYGGAIYVSSGQIPWSVDAATCSFYGCSSGGSGATVCVGSRGQGHIYGDQGTETCTVTLDEGAGTSLTQKVFQIDSGERFYPSQIPTYGGHIFDGWYYYDRNGDLQKWERDSVVLEDVDLIAQYTPVFFTVQFYDDDQTTQLFDPVFVPGGSTLDPDLYSPVRSGYHFVGWWHLSSHSGGMELWTGDDQVLADMMLYAEWEKMPEEESSSSSSESSGGSGGGGSGSSGGDGSVSRGNDRAGNELSENVASATIIEDEDPPLTGLHSVTIDQNPVPLVSSPSTGVPFAFRLALFALVPSAAAALGSAANDRKL